MVLSCVVKPQPLHYKIRGVAQPGRAPGSGPGGRRFESSRPDHLKSFILEGLERSWLLAVRSAVSVTMVETMATPRFACSFHRRAHGIGLGVDVRLLCSKNRCVPPKTPR